MNAFKDMFSDTALVTATRDELAMLAEVLLWCFQDGNLQSDHSDNYAIQIDGEHTSVQCISTGECCSFASIRQMEDLDNANA